MADGISVTGVDSNVTRMRTESLPNASIKMLGTRGGVGYVGGGGGPGVARNPALRSELGTGDPPLISQQCPVDG